MMAAAGGPATLLTASDLAKHFGSTEALAGADCLVHEREIVAVIGDSGAGKSTLLNVISGLERADSGTLVFRGFPISLRSRHDALRIGLAVVEQEAALIPDLTVFDNIVLPVLGRLSHARPADLRSRVAGLLATFGLEAGLPLSTPAHTLTAAQAQMVALARALVARAKLYLFDEPFATLAPREIDGLVGTMMRLRMAGCGLLVTARRLDDVVGFADRITLLAGGRTVHTANSHNADEMQPLRRMPARLPSARREVLPGASRLVLQNVASAPVVTDATLTVRAGEIVALHGMKGAGCRATLEVASGLRRRTGGTVRLDGVTLRAGRLAGLGFAAAAQPLLLPDAPVRDGLQLGSAVDWSEAAELWRSLALPEGGLDRPAGREPAGVRQRIAILSALLAGQAATVLVDPTRGLRPEERLAVHETLLLAARTGRAILLDCPDRDEALAVAGRCVVMRGGRTVAELPCPALDSEALGLLSAPPGTLELQTSMLAELTRENGGAAFWALLRKGQVICLATAVVDAEADPGLKASTAAAFDDTRIPAALLQAGPEFVTEPDSGRSTLLVPIRTPRGRSFGYIGLTLGPETRPPPAAAVAFRIETLAASQ